MRKVGDQPRVPEPRSAPHRRVNHRGKPDGRTALALWLEADPEIANLEALAQIRDLIFGPQPAHDLDALVHALRALLERHVKALELRVAVTDANAKHIAATR